MKFKTKIMFPVFLVILGLGVVVSGANATTQHSVSSDQNAPSCSNYLKYVVTNGELRVHQLLPGDSLKGLFLFSEFNFTEFHNNPANYTLNATITNYRTDSLQFDGNLVKNINSTLNGQLVVVVIKNIDGFFNAFDGFCSDSECQNFRPFIVENNWISIPPLGTAPDAPKPEDIILLGVFDRNIFNFSEFYMNPEQWLQNHTADNYNTTAQVKVGGVQVNASVLQGKHVVLVFRDLSEAGGSQIIAMDGYCDDHSAPPFTTITFGVTAGTILNYKIIVSPSEIPLFNLKDSTGAEFKARNNDTIKIEIKEIIISNNSNNQGENVSPFTVKILLENGAGQTAETQEHPFVMPLEFLQFAVNNSANFTGLGPNNDPNNPFSMIINITDSTITFGSNNTNMSVQFTFALETGILVKVVMKGSPPEAPPEAQLDFLMELISVQPATPTNTSAATITNTSDISNILLTSVSGGEAAVTFIVFILVGLVSLRRRKPLN